MNILYQISDRLGLGTVTESPRQLSGGFLHRMYALTTGRGRFAVKLLNPHIMARPTAMDNYRAAEELEALLEQTDVPILPALTFGGSKMQWLDGQYYYVYEYFGGHALRSGEITEAHCRTIGAQLAKIHRLDLRREAGSLEPIAVDWDGLIAPLAEVQPELFALLLPQRDLLVEMQSLANGALPRLPAVTAICHNDMDSKNVLWRGGECRIIDLECLGWSNPFLELYETALYWSGIEQCHVDGRRFAAFIRAYSEAGGELPSDWTAVHDANTGRLGWLEYNLNRAAGFGCSADEISVGVAEVRKTIAQLAHYHSVRGRIL